MCEISSVDGELLMPMVMGNGYQRYDFTVLKLQWLQEGYCPHCNLRLERHYHIGLRLLFTQVEALIFSVEPSFGHCPNCFHDFALREGRVMVLKPECCHKLSNWLDDQALDRLAVPSG